MAIGVNAAALTSGFIPMPKRIIEHLGAKYQYLDLRAWQEEALTYLGNIEPGYRYRIQAPMGSGKTRVVMRAAFKWLQKSGRNVVIFCTPSVTVTKQVEKEFKENCTVPSYLSGNNVQAPLGARVVFCTHSKLQLLINPDNPHNYAQNYNAENLLLIFIECHHDNYYATANQFATRQFCTVIGESASPWTRACEDYYDENAYVYTLTRAQREGVVCPYRFEYREPKRHELRDYAISYQPSIRGETRQQDAHIHYDMDAEDIHRVMKRWKDGKLNPIRVCGMLTEGFDSPYTQDVVLKESGSLVLTYQCFGRGLRAAKGKDYVCWIKSPEISSTLRKAIEKAG